MDMSKPTGPDLQPYPHCFITFDATWDPSLVDEEFTCVILTILLLPNSVTNVMNVLMCSVIAIPMFMMFCTTIADDYEEVDLPS